jgi:hypothetical protein
MKGEWKMQAEQSEKLDQIIWAIMNPRGAVSMPERFVVASSR